jgi:hypothetical protein
VGKPLQSDDSTIPTYKYRTNIQYRHCTFSSHWKREKRDRLLCSLKTTVDFLAAVSPIGGARRRCIKKIALTTHPRPYALAIFAHIQLPDTSISAAAIGSIVII